MLRRGLLTFFIATVVCGSVFAKPEIPRQSWRSDIATLRPDDRPVPIPWSVRLPFPWTMVQGIWLAEKGEFKSFFSFKMVSNSVSNTKQLLVRQIDSVTCDVIASGSGIATDRTLYAQMRNTVDGRVYSLGLTSFQESVLPKQLVSKPINGKAMIMSISVVNEQRMTHYLGIEKVTEKFNFNCNGHYTTDQDRD